MAETLENKLPGQDDLKWKQHLKMPNHHVLAEPILAPEAGLAPEPR